MKKILLLLLLALAPWSFGQTSYSGHSANSGQQLWQFFYSGPVIPLTYSSRTDLAMYGTGVTNELLPASCSTQSASAGSGCNGSCTARQQCTGNAYSSSATRGQEGAALGYTGNSGGAQGGSVCVQGQAPCTPPAAGPTSSGANVNGLTSYLNGLNATATDPDFGTVYVRATDYSLNNPANYPCLGGGTWGTLFNVGSSGNTNIWAPDETRILMSPSGKPPALAAFNPSTGVVTPTDICASYLPGATTFSSVNSHRLFTTTTDQESTVSFTGLTGILLTGETVQNGTKTALLQAINPASGFAQLGVVTNSGSYSGNVWTGLTSGFAFTAVSNPPVGAVNTYFANAVYKGALCDGATGDPDEAAVCGTRNPWFGTGNACASAGNSTTPACWYVQWELLFNYNYTPGAPDTTHFPSGQNTCIAQNYSANYTGVFGASFDDTSITVIYSDNGQANHTGFDDFPNTTCVGALGASAVGNGSTHTCTGPVWDANWTLGQGCKVHNSMTDLIVGDTAPAGQTGNGPWQMLNGQASSIAVSAVTGTPTPADILIQEATGAETQLTALLDSAGQATNSSWPGWTSWATALGGLIYQNGSTPPNSSSKWYDCGPAPTSLGSCFDGTHLTPEKSITPSALPVLPAFFFPDVMHDGQQSPRNNVTRFSLVQQPDMQVGGTSSVCHQGSGQSCSAFVQSGFTITTGQTVINYGNNATYSPGQRFIFLGLAGANDQYLNCLLPSGVNYCPVWTSVGGGDGGSSGGSIIITDTVGASTGYANTETYNATTKKPLMTPAGELMGQPGFVADNRWITNSLVDHPSLEFGGHSGIGYMNLYLGKSYAAVSWINPSSPATVDGTPNGAVYGPAAFLADAQTPPPGGNYVDLLPVPLVAQQHGTYGDSGLFDLASVVLTTETNCGQAPGNQGSNVCEPSYGSLGDSEILGMENWVSRSSPGSLVGADANYGAGYSNAVYRLGHTFNSNSSWNFNSQNAIGNLSPFGDWLIFASDWNSTLGCMDGTSLCYDSWTASAGAAKATSGVSWTNDGSGNITVTIPNGFCPPGGTQTYPTANGGGTFVCGSKAGQVTLTGFSESWLNNQTLTLASWSSGTWGSSSSGVYVKFTLASVPGATAGPGTETGTQTVTPIGCGSGVPCQRADLFIAHITTAHQ